jgi:GNAT superfamily N-acetyltransferase
LHSEPTSFLAKIQRQLGWESNVFPAVQLLYLAVIKPMQGNGIGTLLLGHAMERTYQIAQMAGVFALTLRPIAGRESFYAKHGFLPYGQAGAMLLPVQSIVDAFEQNA